MLTKMKLPFLLMWLVIFLSGSIALSEPTYDPELMIFHYKGELPDARVGNLITPLGDINNDGYDDIAISSEKPAFTNIFFGNNDRDSIPDLRLQGANGAVRPIDMTGDGFNDLITTEDGRLYFYLGFADSLSSVPYDSILPDSSFNGFDYRGKTAFVDDDSLGDFLVGEYEAWGGPVPSVNYYSGFFGSDIQPDWQFINPAHDYEVSGYEFIDFNGDGFLDICISLSGHLEPAGAVNIYFGPDFGDQPDAVIGQPDFIELNYNSAFCLDVYNVGDYNSDGWEDIGIGYNGPGEGSRILLYFCGPSADTLYDFKLDKAATCVAYAGDVNDDKYDDIICGGSGSWSGTLYLYLGGPRADSLYDEKVGKYDIPVVFLKQFGYRVSAAGDFNGDGIDDFMSSNKEIVDDMEKRYDVFVFAGSADIMTDILVPDINPIPSTFTLYQNHPNPFNPTTQIAYSIPRGSHVRLEIFDILGRKIATLVNKFHPAGEYKQDWLAKNQSSGIYFYKLTVGEETETKRMVLLK